MQSYHSGVSNFETGLNKEEEWYTSRRPLNNSPANPRIVLNVGARFEATSLTSRVIVFVAHSPPSWMLSRSGYSNFVKICSSDLSVVQARG